MKRITYLFLLVSAFSFAQKTASNRPELAKKILDSYVDMAEARGIEVRERLYTIDQLLFFPNGANDHKHTNGVCTIRIGIGEYESDDEVMRGTFHEIGHHMGLKHCLLCSYNIMAEIQDGKATRLFDTNAIRQLYLDIYFEAIRNPKKYNDGHTHY
jgi:hypothetical protein